MALRANLNTEGVLLQVPDEAGRLRWADVFGNEHPVELEIGAGKGTFLLAIAEAGDRVRVTITAGPWACADCLVPENLMRGILGQALGVPEDAIDLTYPPAPSAPEKERP